jgi:hypothetical protein
MSLRVNAVDQAFYLYEGLGDTLPAYNGAWTILGEVVFESDVNTGQLFLVRYPDLAVTGWCGLYVDSDGTTLILRVNDGAGEVSSTTTLTMVAGTRYPLSLHYNGAGTTTVKLDGVPIMRIAGETLPAGTAGERSVQWAGIGGTPNGNYADTTWARWRMWSADLNDAECRAEHRSSTPVRTSGLVSNWPMDAGSGRFNDTVGSNTLRENPAAPIGDGSAISVLTTVWAAFAAAGTSASGTTSATPSYPSGISSSTSDLWTACTGRSNTAATAPTMPAGWTAVTDAALENGTGTWGVDTGTRRVDVFRKDSVSGSESGTQTVSLSGTTNNTLRATILRTERSSGSTLSVAASTGADTTNGTGFSATSSASISLQPGDVVLVIAAQNIDTGTQSSVSLTASGITFGLRDSIRSEAVTNGNDHRHIIDTFTVLSGTATTTLTYAYTISVAGSGPVSFVRIRATEGGATGLTISEATHGHTADSLTLTTSITLVISDCTHGHTADSLTVSTGTLLAIAEASHDHSADALTLSTGTGLQIAEAAHGHTADALSLTMDSTLAIADAAHAHTADNLTLGGTTGVDLVIADAAHAHSVDALALTLDTTLAIAEAQHAHSADWLVLSTDQHLAIQDATHDHSADNVVLSDVPTLTISDAIHGHSADSLSLSTATSLSIADALHSHTAEQILLSTTISLAIAEASHAHTADNLVLSDIPSLAIADSAHAHTADGLDLTLDAWLLIADAVHAHLADSLTLSTDSEFERAPSGGGFRRPAVQSYRPARFSSTPRPTRSNTTRPSR